MIEEIDPIDFWSFVDIRDENDCWEWMGARSKTGYGEYKKYGKAYRISLELFLGRNLGLKMCALHSCDNKICVNPNHLREGTFKDNADDRSERKRYRVPKDQNRLYNIDIFNALVLYYLDGASIVNLENIYGLEKTKEIMSGEKYSPIRALFSREILSRDKYILGRILKSKETERKRYNKKN